MANDDQVTADVQQHPRGWLIVSFLLPLPGDGAFTSLDLMLNTGRPESALSRSMYRTLDALGLVTPVRGTAFALRRARLEDVAMTDIPMRLSVGPGLLGLDGMLGLDFLSQFAEVRLDFQALRLTLIRP